VNDLERNEDADGLWRQFVNDELSGPYIDLFAAIDILLMLKVPGMEQVFKWRLKQEEKLRAARSDDTTADRLMDEAGLRRFIQHYERISRQMLNEMPERADIVFELGTNQQIERIICR
jgi:D-glycerate 3-kinase